MIVEDDETVAAALRRSFDLFRPTLHAATLAEGRALFSAEACCGLVVDLGLPDGSGLELVEEVRAHAPRLPVLILTGTLKPVFINAAYALRADYLCKPGSRRDFVAFIRRALLEGSDPQGRVTVVADEFVVTKSLTKSEAAILHAVATDHGRATLASELGINENTLKTQIRTLLRKCEATTLDDLVRQVLRRAIDG